MQPLTANDFNDILRDIKPKIGNYDWFWHIMRRRKKQTGLIPAKLSMMLGRIASTKPYFIGTTSNGIHFLGDARDNYSIHCQLIADFDEHLITFLKGKISHVEKQFLDVGTNMGVVAASIAHSFPSTPVVAFEPVPETARRAAVTFALNQLTNIHLFQTAVSDQEGELSFFVAKNHSEGASAECNPYVTQHGYTKTIVPSCTLSSLAQEFSLSPGFIKFDVEGHEPAAIAGAMELIANTKPQLLYEWTPMATSGWMPQKVSSLISEKIAYNFSVLHESGKVAPYQPPFDAQINIYGSPAFS